MKFKKILPVLACGLAFTTLAACSAGSQKVEFGRYWQTNSLTKQTVHERLEYSVKFEETAQSLGGIGYKLSYSDGTYVTELTTQTLNGETVYCYSTQLKIKVTYELDGEVPVTNEDIVESVCYFEDKALQPISSSKHLISYTPVNDTVDNVQDLRMEYSYVTTYDKATGEASGVTVNSSVKDHPVETPYEYDFTSGKYNVLDNEQLLFALRAISSSTDNARLRVINPFTGLQTIAVKFDDAETKKFDYTLNGETITQKEIAYRPVTIAISSTNSGATQTAWIAKTERADYNPNHNVMLRLETPLAYNLGTLIYELKSIEYQAN